MGNIRVMGELCQCSPKGEVISSIFHDPNGLTEDKIAYYADLHSLSHEIFAAKMELVSEVRERKVYV